MIDHFLLHFRRGVFDSDLMKPTLNSRLLLQLKSRVKVKTQKSCLLKERELLLEKVQSPIALHVDRQRIGHDGREQSTNTIFSPFQR
jgi:hypothetical protein